MKSGSKVKRTNDVLSYLTVQVNRGDPAQKMTDFFTNHNDTIAGISGIATALSLLAAGIALLFTGYQIRRNSRSNMARTIYDIQRDGREAVRRLLEEKVLAEDLLGKELTTRERVLVEVGGVFNIYLAAFQQKNLKILDAKRWGPIESDLRSFLEFPRAQEFWCGKKDKTQYDPDFVDLVDKLISTASPTPADGSGTDTENQRGANKKMTIFNNQFGHETEGDARQASERLMLAMSELYIALAELERRDVTAANDRRSRLVGSLQDISNDFDQIAERAGDYPLNTSEDHPQANELAELYARLGAYRYNLTLTNRDISRISAQEIRLFSGVVDRLTFQDSPEDWRIGRELFEAATRMLTNGLITSRISVLNPHP